MAENKFDPTILEFDHVAAQLIKWKRGINPIPDNYIQTAMSNDSFFGGRFIVHLDTKDEIIIIPSSHDKEGVYVRTMHISCQSDTYQPGHNYGGVIIYQYKGKSEWRTANNIHCKSGYIVIQDTDSKSVKKWMGKEPGMVHGAVYRNAFGESVNDAEVVGEGFAIRKNEELEITSSVFNNPPNSAFHDFDRKMHRFSEHCIRKVVECWKTAGPCWIEQRNFEVKQLLADLDIKIEDTLY